jgi:predicted permease
MSILNVILSILLVIFIGYFLKRPQFFNNTLVLALYPSVYHILLPVLIFWEISRSPFQKSFNEWLVATAFIPMGTYFVFFPATGRPTGFPLVQVGSLAQGSFRGNIAYVGLVMVTFPIWIWFVGI